MQAHVSVFSVLSVVIHLQLEKALSPRHKHSTETRWRKAISRLTKNLFSLSFSLSRLLASSSTAKQRKIANFHFRFPTKSRNFFIRFDNRFLRSSSGLLLIFCAELITNRKRMKKKTTKALALAGARARFPGSLGARARGTPRLTRVCLRRSHARCIGGGKNKKFKFLESQRDSAPSTNPHQRLCKIIAQQTRTMLVCIAASAKSANGIDFGPRN